MVIAIRQCRLFGASLDAPGTTCGEFHLRGTTPLIFRPTARPGVALACTEEAPSLAWEYLSIGSDRAPEATLPDPQWGSRDGFHTREGTRSLMAASITFPMHQVTTLSFRMDYHTRSSAGRKPLVRAAAGNRPLPSSRRSHRGRDVDAIGPAGPPTLTEKARTIWERHRGARRYSSMSSEIGVRSNAAADSRGGRSERPARRQHVDPTARRVFVAEELTPPSRVQLWPVGSEGANPHSSR
jgi:hypothetical protein